MRLRYTALLAFVAFFGLWLWWGLAGVELLADQWPASKLEKLCQLGDLFGGINALFSVFTLVALAINAWLQRRQILDAQEQATLTQRQHERSMFEPLLFALLDRHRVPDRLVSAFTGMEGSFSSVVSALLERLSQSPELAVASLSGERNEFLMRATAEYLNLYRLNDSSLGPYFRSIYHIFRHISQSLIPSADKAMYASIARASLSETELFLIALNGLHDKGDGLRKYVEEFALLKHIRRSSGDGYRTVEEVLASALFSPDATAKRMTTS